MSENKKTNEVANVENNTIVLQEFLGDLSLKTSDEIADVNTALEQLLNKVQQIWSNNDNNQDVATQAVSLFNQSIDIVEKITFTDSKDLQRCFKYLLASIVFILMP
ncbi:unnamed protein product [Rotaria magnacalcarata]|nr:unnamed protein product [Rotaria magnacalcarata]CAF4055119.1 unnamed protein product [Rotaria magnacalcarata]